ncbi:hypothetical protein NGM10_04795 [Halorussus salilacus]|uniref:hypothetical protein n=1 Tax=Halorussus salilacus TaxID=2953750 RepID=UPI0020A0D22E|nr:hypothetical protein [Halorussus salilacus]USZ69056.1 hypothetical protein NGM10_04795 [Halorussus salilacus]
MQTERTTEPTDHETTEAACGPQATTEAACGPQATTEAACDLQATTDRASRATTPRVVARLAGERPARSVAVGGRCESA